MLAGFFLHLTDHLCINVACRLTVDSMETYVVVMRNVFSSHLKVHTRYDLKGSTVDREVSKDKVVA